LQGQSKKGKKKEKSTDANATRSSARFNVTDSNLTAPLIPGWREELQRAGANFIQLGQMSEASRFPLPEPGILLGSTGFFVNAWLRLRTACLLRMNSPGFKLLPSTQWRSLLLFDNLPDKPDERLKGSQENVYLQLHNLRQAIQGIDDGLSLSLSSLKTAPVQWYGTVYNEVPDAVQRQVFWELSEMHFRYEVVSTDLHYMGVDRSRQVLGHFRWWNRSKFVGRPDTWSQSFSGNSVADRWSAYNDLRYLMLEWPSAPHGLQRGMPLQPTEDNERLIIAGYIQCFLHAFGRPPIIPRGVP
jgi:hypothetical protein